MGGLTDQEREEIKNRQEAFKAERQERIRAYTEEFPRDDKCYIVVKGRPDVWYGNSLPEAERVAAERAEQDRDEYTIMSVPRASVDMALVAKYHGVVLHALDKLESDDE